MTMTVVFNTLAYAEKLKASGVPDEQAKAQATALNEVLSESSGNVLATKQDVTDAKVELKTELTVVKSEIKILGWMMGVVASGVGALILKTFF